MAIYILFNAFSFKGLKRFCHSRNKKEYKARILKSRYNWIIIIKYNYEHTQHSEAAKVETNNTVSYIKNLIAKTTLNNSIYIYI